MEKMKTRLGYNAYHMRRWLRLLWHSRLLSSYPVPMPTLTPGGIDRNRHEVNMWCLCCMMSLCSRTFYFFHFSSVINVVITLSDMTNVTAWPITSNPNPRVLKIEKIEKIENKSKENKNEKENKKTKSTFCDLNMYAVMKPKTFSGISVSIIWHYFF